MDALQASSVSGFPPLIFRAIILNSECEENQANDFAISSKRYLLDLLTSRPHFRCWYFGVTFTKQLWVFSMHMFFMTEAIGSKSQTKMLTWLSFYKRKITFAKEFYYNSPLDTQKQQCIFKIRNKCGHNYYFLTGIIITTLTRQSIE